MVRDFNVLHFIPSSSASPLPLDNPKDVLNSIHPLRPDWYEELCAFILDKGSKAYEAEVAGFKSQIFTNLRGEAKTVLELNLKYYASDNGVHVFDIDPKRKMIHDATPPQLGILGSSSFDLGI
ncbi:uncharacterized protein LOC114304535 [Camellia sinensis]|uniref:uncharacterized protein LOC114304535 n=1 Tax=Camellia sinensis TaxID=4442 RepID=UPI001036B4F0|nr:uncharacterized protein LOC114304535 [Camellia sinensis]